jgi:oxaloacetate decarboxylase alpha subunit
MDKVVNFVDTTIRDGSQSNWAAGMPVGMMKEVIDDIDNAGYECIDAPNMGVNVKKIVRDLKEDFWEMVKMLGRMKTPKVWMGQPSVSCFDFHGYNREVFELWQKTIINMGALQRTQVMGNVYGHDQYDWYIPLCKRDGLEVNFAICYYVSPRHTVEWFTEKIKMMAAYKPDMMYLKDANGLLDLDSIRVMFPLLQKHSNGVPLQLHGHCTQGYADIVYAEALRLGCRNFHVGTPPVAEGTSQPSVFTCVENFTRMGYTVNLDMERVKSVQKKLTAMAKQANLPIMGPTRYNVYEMYHKIPGGVISTLAFQLKELHIEHRLEEVIDEVVRICEETGYPHLITPYSQFVGTQAALNVATGERYKVVIDDMIKVALGYFSDDSGYLLMNQDIKDKILASPRKKEIERIWKEEEAAQFEPIKDVRKRIGGATDEEFLLRYVMNGATDIDIMKEACKKRGGPFQKFSTSDTPIVDLLRELKNQPQVTSVNINNSKGSLVLQKAKLN